MFWELVFLQRKSSKVIYISGGCLSGVLGTGVLIKKIHKSDICICWVHIWCSGNWCPNNENSVKFYISGGCLSGVLGTGVLTKKI